MKVDGRRVGAFVKDPAGCRVVLLYGEDEGLVRSRAEALTVAVAGRADDPFQVAWLGRDEHDRVLDEATAISMMGGRRVVRVRDATDGLAGLVGRVAAAPGDSLVVLEAGALGRKSKLVVLLEGLANGAAVACYPEEGPGLRSAIEAGLMAEGVRADADALDWLRDHLGGDHASTRGEIEKLIGYAGGGGAAKGGRLDLDAVRACVGDQASVSLDNALYAAALGDVAGADLAVERSLADGMQPVGLVRAVLLFFARLHAARGRMEAGASAQEAVKGMRPPVFWKREGEMVRAVGAWAVPRLSAAIGEARRAELACKRTGAPDELIARRLVMALARQGSAARRPGR
jgi:DNA polymerase-3 subunit delta